MNLQGCKNVVKIALYALIIIVIVVLILEYKIPLLCYGCETIPSGWQSSIFRCVVDSVKTSEFCQIVQAYDTALLEIEADVNNVELFSKTVFTELTSNLPGSITAGLLSSLTQVENLANDIKTNALNIINNFGGYLNTTFSEVSGNLITNYNTFYNAVVQPIVTWLLNYLVNPIIAAYNAVNAVVQQAINAITNAYTGLVNLFNLPFPNFDLAGGLEAGINIIVTDTVNLLNTIKTDIIGVANTALTGLTNAVNTGVTTVVNGVADGINSGINPIVSTINTDLGNIEGAINTSVNNVIISPINTVINTLNDKILHPTFTVDVEFPHVGIDLDIVSFGFGPYTLLNQPFTLWSISPLATIKPLSLNTDSISFPGIQHIANPISSAPKIVSPANIPVPTSPAKGFVTAIMTPVNEAIAGLATIKQDIADFFNPIVAPFQSMYNTIYNLASGIITAFKNLDLINLIIPYLQTMLKAFENGATLTFNEAVTSVNNNIVTPILAFFNTVKEDIITGVNDAITTMQPIVNSLITGFKQIFTTSTDFFYIVFNFVITNFGYTVLFYFGQICNLIIPINTSITAKMNLVIFILLFVIVIGIYVYLYNYIIHYKLILTLFIFFALIILVVALSVQST